MRSLPGDPRHPDFSIPDELSIDLDEFHDAYHVWVLWRATGRRFLPTELRKQPEPLISTIIYLDSIFDRMADQVMEQYRESGDV